MGGSFRESRDIKIAFFFSSPSSSPFSTMLLLVEETKVGKEAAVIQFTMDGRNLLAGFSHDFIRRRISNFAPYDMAAAAEWLDSYRQQENNDGNFVYNNSAHFFLPSFPIFHLCAPFETKSRRGFKALPISSCFNFTSPF